MSQLVPVELIGAAPPPLSKTEVSQRGE
jgi:hypothetical protein